MISKKNFLLLASLTAVLLTGCNKEEEEPAIDPQYTDDYYASLYCRENYMNVYYYWANEVKEANAKLDLENYTTEEAFDKMLYKDDRWSFMRTAEEYIGKETGTSTGTWGISISQGVADYNDYGLYVAYILQDSPLAKYGITRGAQLRAVAGIEIGDSIDSQEKLEAFNNHFFDSPNTFTFRLTDGRDTTFTETLPSSVKTNYILKSQVFTEEDFPGLSIPVGYIHYALFEGNFNADLDTVMNSFKSAGIKKIIVDLRYNSGGDISALTRLLSYLAPAGLSGKTYLTMSHNSIIASTMNKSKSFEDCSLGLDEVYFVMGNYSASASECAYNGLKPYLKNNVHHIGKQTYGKPNGMYVLFYPGENSDYTKYNKGDFSSLEYAFQPICFYNTNVDGEQIPSSSENFSGFVPENERPDDIYHDFGVEEDNIKACLTHIVSGEYPEIDMSHSKKTTKGGSRGIVVESLTVENRTDGDYGVCVMNPFENK